MLDRIEASHFSPLTGQVFQLNTPDGGKLALMIDNVKTEPRARMPDAPEAQRMPFSVSLTAQQATTFIDGLCSMELPALGLVKDIFVSRMAPLGRDPSGAYFQIIFN